jgi:hypothetical protein
MASKSFVVPSILVSDERIYRIPGKDKVCRSCGAARDKAKAIISNEIHEEKKIDCTEELNNSITVWQPYSRLQNMHL